MTIPVTDLRDSPGNPVVIPTGERKFRYYQGDNLVSISTTWLDAASVPKDLTGFTGKFSISNYPGHPPVVEIAAVIADPPTGVIEWSAPAATMAPLLQGFRYQDLEITDGTDTWSLVWGLFEITAQVTLPPVVP